MNRELRHSCIFLEVFKECNMYMEHLLHNAITCTRHTEKEVGIYHDGKINSSIKQIKDQHSQLYLHFLKYSTSLSLQQPLKTGKRLSVTFSYTTSLAKSHWQNHNEIQNKKREEKTSNQGENKNYTTKHVKQPPKIQRINILVRI